MKRNLIICTLLVLFSIGISAQRRGLISSRKYDTGGYFLFSAGPAYCAADTYGALFDKSILDGNNWSTSLGFKQVFAENFGYRVNVIYGNYIGEDTNLKYHGTSYNTSYSYSSNILELTLRAEYTIKFGPRFRIRNPDSIYGFVGIGGFHTNVTNPKNQPLIQNTIGAILPVGVGYQYEFIDGLTIGAEAGIQYSFSDSLDGYPVIKTYNDILSNFSITIGCKLF